MGNAPAMLPSFQYISETDLTSEDICSHSFAVLVSTWPSMGPDTLAPGGIDCVHANRVCIKKKINQSFFMSAHWVHNVQRSAMIDEIRKAGILLSHILTAVVMMGSCIIRRYRTVTGIQQS